MRIPTNIQRRLARLRKRSLREREAPQVMRSSVPFRYDACLRIGGLGDIQEQVLGLTGVLATKSHRKGDPVGLQGRSRQEDLWLLASPLGEQASHDEHLEWRWCQIRSNVEQFRILIERAKWSDVCLGCLSESAYPVLAIEPKSLEIVRELRIGLSFNFTVL